MTDDQQTNRVLFIIYQTGEGPGEVHRNEVEKSSRHEAYLKILLLSCVKPKGGFPIPIKKKWPV